MGSQDHFNKTTTVQALANKSAEEIAAEIESVGYQEEDIIREERFIPRVDFSVPSNFVRYGSAEEYYSSALTRIADYYPYDGSLKERIEWENASTYLDLYIFDQKYPRTNGYIIMSADGWGAMTGTQTNGYGRPDSSDNYEYIYVKGGPHPNPDGMQPYSTQFTGSNYYEADRNRESNLKFDLQNKGVSLEFWLKKDQFIDASTEKEVIFDLWNGELSSSGDYGRLRLELTASSGGTNPFRLTALSGTAGVALASVADSTITTATVADNNWHHYALTMKSASAGITSRFYVDGDLNNETTLGSEGINNVDGALRANIGSIITNPSGNIYHGVTMTGAGKLSASVDEFRYWKTERNGREIGRHWFTQVGGGTNTDPTPYVETTENVNTTLGVYYKFNEGITGNASIDSVVLDYSGRVTNGAWTGYASGARSTGSAIVESDAAIKEFKDPIIYGSHPAVVQLAAALATTGSYFDTSNNSSIYHSIPSWITEEDMEGQKNVKYLTQILSSYFDTLHLQIKELSQLKDIAYPQEALSHKPLPFAERLLGSVGLTAPELFIEASVLQKLADRSENRVFEKSLQDVKNTIYQNIYNNLVYIYKTKGTEKSFRNLIRAFGIDDELVKLNMYGNGIEYEVRNNRRNVSVADRFVNFNTEFNQYGTVFQYQDSSDTTNTTGYIAGNTNLTGGYSQTLEADILFPLKPSRDSEFYFNTNTISASLFGMHSVIPSQANTQWDSPDWSNFQVYAERDELFSDNARFVLTGTAGGLVPELRSDLYEDLYNNTKWNLAVRVRPEKYPLMPQVWISDFRDASPSGSYVVELHGIQIDSGVVLNEFTISGSLGVNLGAVDNYQGFLTGSKRAFIGAHKTNFTGSSLESSDVKVNACRYWLDYLDNETLRGHAYDTQNYGTLNPHRYAYSFVPSASYGEILKADTLVFNWEFAQNTGSSAAGKFTVADESSGSAAVAANRFGWLGDILGMQHTATGWNFPASSTKVVDKDFVISSKLQLPENVQSSEMVQVLNAQEQNVFTKDSRPINYFFAFEKSMAAAISVEMINYFATLRDINNIVGAPVEKYRPEYKGLKILRQRFFERVSNNEIDFEKFYEFYKWFDSSLTTMLQQLVPASADFAENVRTIVESHMLERSKYQNKFQNVKKQDPIIQGVAVGGETSGEMSASPTSDPQGLGFYSMNAFSRRQIGSSQPINYKWWRFTHAPEPRALPPQERSMEFPGATGADFVGFASGLTDADLWNSLIGGSGDAAKPFSLSAWVNPTDFGESNNGRVIDFFFGDRFIRMSGGPAPGTPRLVFTVDGSSQGQVRSANDSVPLEEWTHVLATFAGGDPEGSNTADYMKLYINGVLDTTVASELDDPGAIAGASMAAIGARVNSGPTVAREWDGHLCDVAVWNKELSAVEAESIYSNGNRIDLLSIGTVKDSLLAWWELGGDPRDTYNGTIYDQVGNYNGTPVSFAADAIQAESPPIMVPYSAPSITKNNIWWTSRAERGNQAISGSLGALNKNKQTLLTSNKVKNLRASQGPYRFGGSGTSTLGGVGFSQNKKVNFVYRATTPFGSVRAGAVENAIIGRGDDVEQLIDTTDIYHPAYKQRLGFWMDPDANRDNGSPRKGDGNLFVPFSIYSSSVTDGYNDAVVDNYASNIQITNLHNDLVYNSDIPAQGPFTEKFVGGREHRHIALNDGEDTGLNRAEGFKLELASSQLQILPPNYADNTLGYNAAVPTAHQLRNVGTKRPVNIQNIMMTTASLGTRLEGVQRHGSIGNYQRNYQVVMSNSRRINDPFFNDQSFDFALFPETLATRGRKPMQGVVGEPNSLYFTDDDETAVIISSAADDSSEWEELIGGANAAAKPFSISMWFRPVGEQVLSNIGLISFGQHDRSIVLSDSTDPNDMKIFGSVSDSDQNYCVSDETLGTIAGSEDASETWFHIVWTYSGGTSGDFGLYINGVDHFGSELSVAGPTAIGTVSSRIGDRAPAFTNRGFTGNICDVAIWTRAINASEAANLYNNRVRKDPRIVVRSSMVAYWPLGAQKGDDPTSYMHNLVTGSTGGIRGLPVNFTSTSLQNVSPPSATNVSGTLNYALPSRIGANSNQSIIVNRFAGSGYEVMSRGYMGPAHEEMSVYNALPYHNLSVIDYGLSGSASVDPSLTDTIRVQDQIGKVRGLDQRSTLHCGPFGSDAAYGSVPVLTYVTTPSYQKVNRNAKTVFRQADTEWSGEFNGSSTSIDIGASGTWNDLIGGVGNAAKPFTISAWVYQEDDNTKAIVDLSEGDAQVRMTSTNKIYFGRNGSTDGVVRSSAHSVPAETWTHVACTYAGGEAGEMKIYIDGVDDTIVSTVVAGPTAIAGADINIGSRDNSSRFFEGHISDVAIWDKALTEAEVGSVYNQGYAGAPTTGVGQRVFCTDNLIAWYRFNSDFGDSDSTILNQITTTTGTDGVGSNLTLQSTIAPPTLEKKQVYDNLYVQHPIPRSKRQYSWVTASIADRNNIYGLDQAACYDKTTLCSLMQDSTITLQVGAPMGWYTGSVNFVGMSPTVPDGVATSEHLLEAAGPGVTSWSMRFPGAPTSGSYSGYTSLAGPYWEGPDYQPPIGVQLVDDWPGSTTGIDNWNSVIGGTGGSTEPFTIAVWVNAHSSSAGWITNTIGSQDLGASLVSFPATPDGSSGNFDRVTLRLRPPFDSATGAAQGEIIGFIDRGSDVFGVSTADGASLIGTGWHHVVWTYDGVTINPDHYIYVDGVDVTDQIASGNGTATLDIGGLPYIGSNIHDERGFHGDIANVTIFGSVLGSTGVLALYNKGMYFDPREASFSSTSLLGYYNLTPFPGPDGGSPATLEIGASPSGVPNQGLNAPAHTNGVPIVGPPPGFPKSSPLRFANSGPPDRNYFNILNLTRNGPYGYPTWKQIRRGETKVARVLRKKNRIGITLPPPFIPRRSIEGAVVGFDRGLKSNKFVDYVESPVVSTAKPIFFAFEDNDASPNTANNLAVDVSYQNNIDFFSNPGLNKRLNLVKVADEGNAYNTLANFAVNSSLSFMVRYEQTIYPREINMYQKRVREREIYSIAEVWNNCPTTRWSGVRSPNSQVCDNELVEKAENKFLYKYLYGDVASVPNSLNSPIRGASVWPLDFEFSGTLASTSTAIPGWNPWMNAPSGSANPVDIRVSYGLPWRPDQDGKGNAGRGSGELMNTYSRFCFPAGLALPAGITTAAYTGSIQPACSYVMPIFGGWSRRDTAGGTGGFYWLNGITAVGQVPWTAGAYYAGQLGAEGIGSTPFQSDPNYPVPYWKTMGQAGNATLLGGNGIAPYISYDQFGEKLRCVRKDYTIVPEFRMSDHIEDFITHHNSNFLDHIQRIFELTGSVLGAPSRGETRTQAADGDEHGGSAAVSDHATGHGKEFYKLYSTTEFMKYFKVVDDDFAGQTNALGSNVERHSLKLTCNALLQFLPYQGLYPAERTLALGSFLSKSLGPIRLPPQLVSGGYDLNGGALRRILYEPLMAPGILFNTIKSGIAVSNFVVGSCAGTPSLYPKQKHNTPDGLWSLPLQFYSQVSQFPLYEDLLRSYSSAQDEIRGGEYGTGNPTWVCDVTRQLGDRDYAGLLRSETVTNSYLNPDGDSNPGGVAPMKRGWRPGVTPQIMSKAAIANKIDDTTGTGDSTEEYLTETFANMDNAIFEFGTGNQQQSGVSGSYMMPLLSLITLDQYPSLPHTAPTPDDKGASSRVWGATQGHSFGGYFYHKIPFEAIRDPDKYLSHRSVYNGWLYDTGLGMAALDHSGSLLNPDNSLLINKRGDIRTRLQYSGQSKNPLYKMAIDNFLCETYNFFMKGPKNSTFLSKQEEDFLPVVKDQYYGLQVDLGVPERWGWDTMIKTLGTSSKEPGDWASLFLPVQGDTIRCTASLIPPEEVPIQNRSFGMYSRASAFGPPIAIYGQPGNYGLSDSQFAYYTIQNNVMWSYEHVLPPYFYGSAKANIIYKAPYSGRVTVNEILANSVVEYNKDHFWGEPNEYPGQGASARVDPGAFDPNQMGLIPPLYPGKSLANYFQLLGSCSADLYVKNPSSEAQGGFTVMDQRLRQESLLNQIDSSVNLLEKLLVVPEGTNTQEARWMIQPKFETPVLNFHNAPATQIDIGQGFRTQALNEPSGFSGSHTRNGTGRAIEGIITPAGANSLAQVTGSKNPYLETRGMWHQYGQLIEGSDGITLSLKDMPTRLSSSNYGVINVSPLAPIVGFESTSKRIGDFAPARLVEEAVVCVPFLSIEAQRKFFEITETTPQYTRQLAILNKYIFPPTFDYLINPTVKPIAFYAFEFELELVQEDLIRIWQNLAPASTTAQEFVTATEEVTIRDLVDRLLESNDELQWLVFKVKKRAEKDYNIYTRKNLIPDSLPIAQPGLPVPYSFNWPYDYFSIVERIQINSEVVYATEDIITESNDDEVVPPRLIEYIPGIITIPPRRRPQPPVPIRPPRPPRARPAPRPAPAPTPPRRPRIMMRPIRLSLPRRPRGSRSLRSRLRRPLRMSRSSTRTSSTRRSTRTTRRGSSRRYGSSRRR